MQEIDIDRIQKDLFDGLDDIWDAYIDAGREPSDQVLDGIGGVLMKSRNEIRRQFTRRQSARQP